MKNVIAVVHGEAVWNCLELNLNFTAFNFQGSIAQHKLYLVDFEFQLFSRVFFLIRQTEQRGRAELSGACKMMNSFLKKNNFTVSWWMVGGV